MAVAVAAALVLGILGVLAPAGRAAPFPAWASGAKGVRTGWATAGPVRAPGGPYLTDSSGRKLELHGVNLVAKCGGGAVPALVPGTPCVGPDVGSQPAYVLSPTAADPARRFTAQDAQTLAGLGFNIVRLGIVWEGLEPGPTGVGIDDPVYCAHHRRGTPFPALGSADPYDPATVAAYLASTDRIVSELASAGLRVIIDMHSDVYGSAFSNPFGTTPWNGEGAPPWATCTDSRRFVDSPGWGDGYTSRAVQIAIHHFFANDVTGDLQGQYARVWTAVAHHYSNDPDVIGYEVYNEPNDFLVKNFNPELSCDYGGWAHEPKSCLESHTQPVPDGLIGAIERSGGDHLVFFEPSGATDYGVAETLGISEPLRFPRLALAFHVYGSIPQQLAQTAAERDRTHTDQLGGPGWIMDEFGGSGLGPPTAQAVSAADAVHLSWAYWSGMQLDDPTGADPDEGLLDQQTRLPYPAVAHALAVPYPWATAGAPGRQSFDYARRSFHYTYLPDYTIRAPTEISVPAYAYPHGYAVRVHGAKVVSRREATVLEVVAKRPAPPRRHRQTAHSKPAAPAPPTPVTVAITPR